MRKPGNCADAARVHSFLSDLVLRNGHCTALLSPAAPLKKALRNPARNDVIFVCSDYSPKTGAK